MFRRVPVIMPVWCAMAVLAVCASVAIADEKNDLDQKILQMENDLHWQQGKVNAHDSNALKNQEDSGAKTEQVGSSAEDKANEEYYMKYKIVKYTGVYYGIDPKDSSVDIKNIVTQARFPWVSAANLNEVKAKIDELLLFGTLGKNAQKKEEPFLVELNYKTYNIIHYENTFYGVSQREGSLDIRDIAILKTKEPWFSDKSLAIVKSKIDDVYQKLPLKIRIKAKLRSFINIFSFN